MASMHRPIKIPRAAILHYDGPAKPSKRAAITRNMRMAADRLALLLHEPMQLIKVISIPVVRDETHEHREAAREVGGRWQEAHALGRAQDMPIDDERAHAQRAEIEGDGSDLPPNARERRKPRHGVFDRTTSQEGEIEAP